MQKTDMKGNLIMKRVERRLSEEIKMLEHLVKDAELRLKSAPQGKLCVSAKGKGYECYLVEEERKDGYKKTYISVNEKELSAGLAQKEYDQKMIAYATKRISGIRKFLKLYEATSLDKLYDKIHLGRKNLIRKMYISDDEYARHWQHASYLKKKMQEDDREIYTEKGERVRSKSEKIIADKLYSLGIAYRYECQLKLAGNVILHPDFTILKMPERKEVYLEHLGMLDDGEYVDGAIWKLNVFEKNGIYLGERLFLTHETGKHPLNMRTLDGMLRAWFLEE